MEEYCAEDVARALGVSHKDLQKVWTQVWAKHRASVLGSATPDAHSVDVVTQRRELIRMPFEKTIPVLKRVCVQIGQFYEPARFANRDDAAEFCRVVKQIVQTNKATVPVAAAPPAVVDEPAPVPAASPPPGSPCAKGGKLYGTLQCGTLHDGTKMDITGGRMHPEAVAEESREETQRKAQIEAQIVGAKLDGIDKKIASLKVRVVRLGGAGGGQVDSSGPPLLFCLIRVFDWEDGERGERGEGGAAGDGVCVCVAVVGMVPTSPIYSPGSALVLSGPLFTP
jgi:hypothetical protein